VIIKGTRVNGVYDSDPEKNSNAKMYKKLSYIQVMERDLRVMDLTAITLCQENKLPIKVFNMNSKGNLRKLINGDNIGTLIC
jgi:uridylate kinase